MNKCSKTEFATINYKDALKNQRMCRQSQRNSLNTSNAVTFLKNQPVTLKNQINLNYNLLTDLRIIFDSECTIKNFATYNFNGKTTTDIFNTRPQSNWACMVQELSE